MRYRVYFEPIDEEINDLDYFKTYFREMDIIPSISKIILIDEHGFPIEQPKQVE